MGRCAVLFLSVMALLCSAQAHASDGCWMPPTRSAAQSIIAACTSRLSSTTNIAKREGIYQSRGEAYDEVGQSGKAISDFSAAIALSRESKDLFNEVLILEDRAGVYEEGGRLKAAIADYHLAIRIDLDPKTNDESGEAAVVDEYYLGRDEYLANVPGAADDLASYILDTHTVFEHRDAYQKRMFNATMWLHLARLKAGAPDSDAATLARYLEGVDFAKWPGPVFSLYLGKTSMKKVMTKVPGKYRCFADYWVGEYELAMGQNATANHSALKMKGRSLLRQARKVCAGNGLLDEWQWAARMSLMRR